MFREASGKDILLNACIGEPGRYALGNVDIARLGGDIGSNWATIRSNLMQLFMGVPTNGIWWQADPDVFYMRREITSLTAEENYLLTGTVGLIGGVFITSDYPSQWSDSAKEAVAEFWNNDGPRVPFRNYILYSDKGIPEAFCVSYNDGKAPQHRIGFYNWTSDRLSKQIPLSAFSINPAVNWKSSAASKSYPADINMDKQKFIIKNQPANSLRIINLTEK